MLKGLLGEDKRCLYYHRNMAKRQWAGHSMDSDNRRGGALALVTKQEINTKPLASGALTSFEYAQ